MQFNHQFNIGNRLVGKGAPVFIIAEAGVNHNGDMDLARALIDAAADAGADAVKFQTFQAHKLNTRSAPKSSYHLRTTPSDEEQSWFELLRTQELSRGMHLEIITHCSKRGIMFLSTPYDPDAADLLADLNVPAFKVASTDANNYPFLKHLAKFARPILLSTAMCTLEEVRRAIETIHQTGNRDLVVLHCTANYPCVIENTNLLAMKQMAAAFDVAVGYSDHNLSHINPIAAVALGATVIEKHFTLSKDLPGPDHQASLTPGALARMVRDVRDAEKALGNGSKAPLPCEQENRRKLRKSIVAGRFITKGETIKAAMIAFKRPGTGIPPGEWNRVAGAAAACDIPEDTLITDAMITRHPENGHGH
ncbi:MAG: N-acetylneuraminate synthase [Pseudomonadota bacterium]